MDKETIEKEINELNYQIYELKKGPVHYIEKDKLVQVKELKDRKDFLVTRLLDVLGAACPFCHADLVSINENIICCNCHATSHFTTKGSLYWISDHQQTCIQCRKVFDKGQGHYGYCSVDCFDKQNETVSEESEDDIDQSFDYNPFEIIGSKTEEIIPPKPIKLTKDEQFYFIKYPLEYDNYTELLYAEFGQRFNEMDAYDRPEKVIWKINKDRYAKLGGINKTVNVVCEICHQEFKYIYRGGRKRMPCPVCSDWTKRFPNEDGTKYGRVVRGDKG